MASCEAVAGGCHDLLGRMESPRGSSAHARVEVLLCRGRGITTCSVGWTSLGSRVRMRGERSCYPVVEGCHDLFGGMEMPRFSSAHARVEVLLCRGRGCHDLPGGM